MKLHELKEWINSLSDDFLQYEVVCSEFGELVEDYEYRLDKPIAELSVDTDNEEIIILSNKE